MSALNSCQAGLETYRHQDVGGGQALAPLGEVGGEVVGLLRGEGIPHNLYAERLLRAGADGKSGEEGELEHHGAVCSERKRKLENVEEGSSWCMRTTLALGWRKGQSVSLLCAPLCDPCRPWKLPKKWCGEWQQSFPLVHACIFVHESIQLSP